MNINIFKKSGINYSKYEILDELLGDIDNLEEKIHNYQESDQKECWTKQLQFKQQIAVNLSRQIK